MTSNKKHDDLKPYKPFGLSMLQLMGLIIAVTLLITLVYSLLT